MLTNEEKVALAKRGESGCFDDSCELSHCSVCGRHFAGSIFGVGVERHVTRCSYCEEVLTEEDREVVQAARKAKLSYLYPETVAPEPPVDPEFDAWLDKLNDEAEAERRANRRLADLHQQRAERDNPRTE